MRRINNLIAITAFSLAVLCLPAIASAQYGSQNDPYDRYGNGQYGNYDTRSTLRDLKNRTRQMQRQIDRELDHGRLNGSYREDQINDLATRFKDSVNNLDNSYNNRNDNEVRRVMDQASQLDRAISRSGLSYNVVNQWSAIRNDLRVLGIGYGNNNRSNRNNRNGGWNNGGNGGWNNGGYNKPSWWPF
jgi:hypothetical protein